LVLWRSTSGQNGSYDFAYSFTIDHRSDTVVVPSSAGFGDGDHMRLGIIGFDRDWHVRTVSYGNASGARLTFELQAPRRGNHGGHGGHANNDKAEWYVWLDNEQFGPVTAQRVGRMFRNGRV